MPRAKAKIQDASRELKYPLGYVLPNGYVYAAVCHKDWRGFWHSGYKYEHRLVMEWWLERKLYPDEYVRHLDGDRTNNRFENLEIISRQEHFRRLRKISRARGRTRVFGGSR
jgi:HNH endonuclease